MKLVLVYTSHKMQDDMIQFLLNLKFKKVPPGNFREYKKERDKMANWQEWIVINHSKNSSCDGLVSNLKSQSVVLATSPSKTQTHKSTTFVSLFNKDYHHSVQSVPSQTKYSYTATHNCYFYTTSPYNKKCFEGEIWALCDPIRYE